MSGGLSAADIAAIERATAEAVAPERVEEVDGWLVCRDPGTITRAHSAAPLSHRATPAALDWIEGLYREAGYPAVFRVAEAPDLARVVEKLTARRYVADKPTLVKTGTVAAMLAAGRGAPAEVEDRPGPGWGDVFTSEGFDPADGASRVAALTRASDAVYGWVREGDTVLAVGVMAFGQGWASVHGMRTRADRRGEGLAGRVLAGLAEAAHARGIDRVFLQVEDGNPARSLYRGFGFSPAWRYVYWRSAAARTGVS